MFLRHISQNRQKTLDAPVLGYHFPMEKQLINFCLSLVSSYTDIMAVRRKSGFSCSGPQMTICHNETLFFTIELVNKILIIWSIFILENFFNFFEKNHLAKKRVSDP